MCTSPITLKNPNYDTAGNYPADFRKTHNTTFTHMEVPCGNCSECKFIKQSGYYQRILEEARCSYVFFCTLTYNNNIESITYQDTTYSFAPYRDFQLMIKRIKKDNLFTRPFSYLAVREYGKKKGRAHFHILFFLRKYDDDTFLIPYQLEVTLQNVVLKNWQRNIGTSLNPEYLPLTTYHETYLGGKLYKNYDLHYVQSKNLGDEDNVYYYVTKYILKDNKFINKLSAILHDDTDLSKEDRLYLRRHLLLNSWRSLRFGLPYYDSEINDDSITHKRISSMIDRSIQNGSEFPQYFCEDGKALPLSRYYRTKYITMEQDLVFKERCSLSDTDFIPKRQKTDFEVMQSYLRGEKVMSIQRDFDLIDLDDFYDD